MTYMWALYAREVKRFQKIWMDTVFSPIVSTILFLSVFGIVAGGQEIGGLPYVLFIYVGLLSMNIVNSSFSNPAFALVIGKNTGTIVDLQLAPLRPWSIGVAYALAALTRALLTIGLAVLVTGWFIPELGINNPFLLLLAFSLTALEFGMLGVTFGMWAKGFESLTFMTTFVMQPMIFLAGVFYPIANLPAPWDTVSAFNPLHHNINLLRYAVTGYSDGNPMISLVVVAALAALVFVAMHLSTKKKMRAL
ncbi:MAG: Inner membrane transport permease YadH [Nitrosomonadaceae bacterium]|nr:Inner membrane transport permease YadH [Nitrosomonadaceae bacterium]